MHSLKHTTKVIDDNTSYYVQKLITPVSSCASHIYNVGLFIKEICRVTIRIAMDLTEPLKNTRPFVRCDLRPLTGASPGAFPCEGVSDSNSV